ncbi:MAG: transcriptional coactivator p15/PC4 family protein [Alphaproteobacteria bacterium]|nr:transcriptional coactivator p15/PC4 family protein [Alphaproteobacteria bacterium]
MMQNASNNVQGEGGNALPHLCAEWSKGRDVVRVSVTEYRGKPLIDLRCWYEAAGGELKPSPKGITLSLETLPRLADALTTATAFAMANGLIVEGGVS